MNKDIVLIDAGTGNLRSVQKAFAEVGFAAGIISAASDIAQADKIVLPGVGAFQDAVATLRAKGFAEPLVRHIEKDKPFLGICLGLQMLFDVGYEDATTEPMDLCFYCTATSTTLEA